MADAEKKLAAVYVSWKTFENSITALSKGEIPNVIDKSVFPGMAYSVQNQFFTALRFLGLIDQDNKPLPDLAELCNSVERRRKEKLSEILQRRYSELFAINLKKATPAEVEKKIADAYGNVGDTKEKAVRFFVSAAEYAGIELSPLLLPKKGANGGRTTAQRKRAPRRQSAPAAIEQQAKSGTSKTVRLQSGGTLTLSATLDLFALNPEDRKFVFDLIDKLDGYKQPEGNPVEIPSFRAAEEPTA